jgi:hypothetical protein
MDGMTVCQWWAFSQIHCPVIDFLSLLCLPRRLHGMADVSPFDMLDMIRMLFSFFFLCAFFLPVMSSRLGSQFWLARETRYVW